MKQVMLFFGSFNPIHKGHIALAEYVVEERLCDMAVFVVSPQNPLKSPSGLASELERFNMVEMAVEGSRFPEQIKVSAIEFTLPKPSYTIDTLRYLQSVSGDEMHFSLLIGADIVEQLEQWKENEEILQNYPIYLYPRKGERVEKHLDKLTLLEGAPTFELSSTEIRERLRFGESVDGLLHPKVLKHIQLQGLWESDEFEGSEGVNRLTERGRHHYQREAWGDALNSFGRALKIEPENGEAKQLQKMTKEILEFRYTDIYNP
ncbi:MAG: nicotinate (nicotinamide) nucleotide adenylyltransferase [Rikenellaceae bacterium]